MRCALCGEDFEPEQMHISNVGTMVDGVLYTIDIPQCDLCFNGLNKHSRSLEDVIKTVKKIIRSNDIMYSSGGKNDIQ